MAEAGSDGGAEPAGSSVPVSAAVEYGAADVSHERDEDDTVVDIAWDGPDATLVGAIDTVSGGGGADCTLLLSGSTQAPVAAGEKVVELAAVLDAGQEMGPEQPVPASEALVGGDEAMQVASEANAGEVIAQEPVEGQRAQNGGGGSRRGLVERQLRRSTRKAGSTLDHIAERVGGDGCRAESVDCGGGGAATGKRKGSEEQERQGGDHRSVLGRAEKKSTAKKKPVSQRKPREARLAQGFSNKEKVWMRKCNGACVLQTV